MEFLLLAKIGMVINGIVWAGYTMVGGYAVKIGMQYVKDYKESVESEKGLKIDE